MISVIFCGWISTNQTAWQYFDHFGDGGAIGVAEGVAATVAALAIEATEEVGEAVVDLDAEVAAGVAGVGDFVLLKDAAERNLAL